MVLFTDGLIEAWEKYNDEDDPERMFGQEKLIHILKETGKNSSEEIKQRILSELGVYSFDDDVTFVILKKI